MRSSFQKVNADKLKSSDIFCELDVRRKSQFNWPFNTFRVKSEIDQFVRGLNDVGGLWETIKKHPAEFESLFTRRPVALCLRA